MLVYGLFPYGYMVLGYVLSGTVTWLLLRPSIPGGGSGSCSAVIAILCLLKDFLFLICYFSEGMAVFYKKSYWKRELKEAALLTTEVTRMRRLINQHDYNHRHQCTLLRK